MTDYIIDITIDNIYDSDTLRDNRSSHTLYIKIDKNGNVDIKRKITHYNPWGGSYFNTADVVTINDNIPIPYYIINMIKNSFCEITTKSKDPARFGCCHNNLNSHHYENAIENIIILKEDIAKSQSIIDLL